MGTGRRGLASCVYARVHPCMPVRAHVFMRMCEGSDDWRSLTRAHMHMLRHTAGARGLDIAALGAGVGGDPVGTRATACLV